MKIFKIIILVFSICIFLLSLFFTAFTTDFKEANPISSWSALVFGIIDAIGISPGTIWIANPIFMSAWFTFFKFPRTSLTFSFIATIISGSFLLVDKINTNGVMKSSIISYNLGYWLWLLSMSFFLLSSLLIFIAEKTSSRTVHQPRI